MKRRAALLLLPLAGCSSVPVLEAASPRPLELAPSRVLPTGAGHLWRADPVRSRLRIVAFRGGALGARVGHHHILLASAFEADLWLPEQGLDGASGSVRVPLAELELDRPEWRTAAGGEFNERPIDADAVAATRRNLLSALNASAHPEVRLDLIQLTGAAPWWVATVRVTLAGRAHDYTVALEARLDGGAWRTQGRLALRHHHHGLQPFSLLGGLLAVQDLVVLEFDLHWQR